MTLEEHKKLGIAYFNSTWDYLDKTDRNKDDDLKMIHVAHASRFHWEQSGAPIINIVRGDWQVSRVYSVLGMGESALFHARSCLSKTIENKIDDFDLVFAHECMANAYKVIGDQKLMNEHLKLGFNAIDQVKSKENKQYCENELNKIKK